MGRNLQLAVKASVCVGACLGLLVAAEHVAVKQRLLSWTTARTQNVRERSPEENLAVFDEIWATINNEYYDPTFHGLDWGAVRGRYRPRVESAGGDADFLRLVESMLSELRDAHTRYSPPDGVRADERPARGRFDVSLGWAEGKVIVASVESGSEAARAGVRPGMVVVAVNGRPTERLFSMIRSEYAGSSSERAMKGVMLGALLYGGFLGYERTLSLEGFDSRVTEVKLSRSERAASPEVSARRLADRLGYVKLGGWGAGAGAAFGRELAALRETAGLVIDLRGNGGGSRDEVIEVASNFFTRQVGCGANRNRSGGVEKYATFKVAEPYERPVVVLVDAESASASEIFASVMQEHGRALVVGRQTCGCALNQATRRIRGGGALSWSYRLFLSPKGRVLEGDGVVPNETVPLRIADVRRGRDADLDRAVAELNRRAAAPARIR